MKKLLESVEHFLIDFMSIVVLCLILSGAASAIGLQVAPTTIELNPKELAQKIWLSNTSNEQTQAQIRIYRWTQDGNKETLTPTQDLAVSPPMLTVLPNDKSLVRLIKIAPATDQTLLEEQSYRIIVNEVPVATANNNKTISFVAEYSIPVFFYNGKNEQFKPEVTLSFVQNNDVTALQVSNRGNGHAKLSSIEFIDNKGKKTLINSGLLGYVLPGQTRLWDVKAVSDALDQGGKIEFNLNDKKTSQPMSGRTSQ